jgi:hypothetical protein
VTTLEVLAPTTTLSPPWQAVENPRIRGVLQNRITAVSAGDVPGAGLFKPATAMRVELRPFHNADITVTTTANAAANATTLSMSSIDVTALFDKDFLECTRTNEMFRVNGAPSGTTITVLRGLNGYAAPAATITGDTFTVPCGDVSDSNNTYATSRAEVYNDLLIPVNSAPELWADPVGSIRWMHWAVFVSADFIPAPNDYNPLICMQIKGANGGGPPIGFSIHQSLWRIDAKPINAAALATINDGLVGPVNIGGWTDFHLGLRLSPDPAVGWLEMWMDRTLAVPHTAFATMDYQADGVTADPIYLKQGLYRNPLVTDTHVLHFGPLTIADSSVDFGLSSPPVLAGVDTGEHWGVQA